VRNYEKKSEAAGRAFFHRARPGWGDSPSRDEKPLAHSILESDVPGMEGCEAAGFSIYVQQFSF
jgi:hypothetical protein